MRAHAVSLVLVLAGWRARTLNAGVSACVIRAALFKIGVTNVPVYDGSYTEWKVLDNPTYDA
jgi:hypothetical protein